MVTSDWSLALHRPIFTRLSVRDRGTVVVRPRLWAALAFFCSLTGPNDLIDRPRHPACELHADTAPLTLHNRTTSAARAHSLPFIHLLLNYLSICQPRRHLQHQTSIPSPALVCTIPFYPSP